MRRWLNFALFVDVFVSIIIIIVILLPDWLLLAAYIHTVVVDRRSITSWLGMVVLLVSIIIFNLKWINYLYYFTSGIFWKLQLLKHAFFSFLSCHIALDIYGTTTITYHLRPFSPSRNCKRTRTRTHRRTHTNGPFFHRTYPHHVRHPHAALLIVVSI